jgi:8-oxo-dGTP pyrophosphatase MutT (NUDIX family)
VSPHRDAASVLAAWQAPDASQEQLRAEFAGFLAAHPDGTDRSCRAGHVTASTLVVQPSTARVLLTRHAIVGRWLQLGGHCEPGDVSLASAAAREAREESGLDDLALSDAPLRLDRHLVRCRWDGGTSELHHLDVQYLAVAAPDAQPHAEADAPLRWFGWDALPDDTDDAVRALVAAARTSLVE